MLTEDLHSLTKVLRGCCANSGVNTMLFQEDNNVLLRSAPHSQVRVQWQWQIGRDLKKETEDQKATKHHI